MIFSDIDFILFLPLAFAIYWLLPKTILRSSWLLGASYLFYANGRPFNVVVLISITLLSYFVSWMLSRIEDQKLRSLIYFSGLISHIFIFLSFKTWWEALLPIGFSFYLLQSISVMTDNYRKTNPHEKNFLYFALYLAFFPSLMAGPISRAHDLIPKFKAPKFFTQIDWSAALGEFTLGIFKKAYCADYLSSTLVNPVFANPAIHSKATLFTALIGYTLQIYCDFSGYSNMARGVARLFGIELMVNFNFPLLSNSFVEFWTRWHISLSLWLRDYIYYPLLKAWGKVAGVNVIVVVTLITWAMAGVWHGTGINYLLYGLFQGTAVAITTVYRMKKSEKMRKLGIRKAPDSFSFTGFIATFFLFNISMLLFRSRGPMEAIDFLKLMLSSSGEVSLISLHILLIFAFTFGENIVGRFGWDKKIIPENAFARGFLVGVVLVYIFLVAPKNYLSFIYFQF